MFLMATMDGRSCALIEEGSEVHAVGRAVVDDRVYFRVETKLDPGDFWWVPHFWDPPK
jgi:hypothetical protein